MSPQEIAASVDLIDSRSPALGAKVVARAWADPAFKKLLLKDTRAALMQMGIDIGAAPEFATVENTPRCTTSSSARCAPATPRCCSAFRRPGTRASPIARARWLDPRGVLAEFGVEVPEDVEVRVHDSTADLRYIVLPMRPKGTKGWSEDELAAIVTRDCMIGTALPLVPREAPTQGGLTRVPRTAGSLVCAGGRAAPRRRRLRARARRRRGRSAIAHRGGRAGRLRASAICAAFHSVCRRTYSLIGEARRRASEQHLPSCAQIRDCRPGRSAPCVTSTRLPSDSVQRSRAPRDRGTGARQWLLHQACAAAGARR